MRNKFYDMTKSLETVKILGLLNILLLIIFVISENLN